MSIPIEGQIEPGQSLKSTSWKRRNGQSPREQLSRYGCNAKIEEEGSWVDDEHQIAIRIDAGSEVLQRFASRGDL